MVETAREPSGVAKATQTQFEQVGAGTRVLQRSGSRAAQWPSSAPRTRQPPAPTCLPRTAACLPTALQVALPRGQWDDSQGSVLLTKYALAEQRAALEAGMLQGLAGCYLAHAAAGALLRCAPCGEGLVGAARCWLKRADESTRGGLKQACAAPRCRRRYLEQPESGVLLTGGGLAVRHAACDTHMLVDPATAAALELVQPVRVGTCSSRLSGMSLFRWGAAGRWAAVVGAARKGCQPA